MVFKFNNYEGKYCNGLESEPEYVFVLNFQKNDEEQLGVWDGYIMDIMDQVKPGKNGWTAFALEYQVYERYKRTREPWLIPNLKETYEQFKSVASASFEFEETREVLARLLDMMERALKENGKLYIYYI